jgi:hypothetical protein
MEEAGLILHGAGRGLIVGCRETAQAGGGGYRDWRRSGTRWMARRD